MVWAEVRIALGLLWFLAWLVTSLGIPFALEHMLHWDALNVGRFVGICIATGAVFGAIAAWFARRFPARAKARIVPAIASLAFLTICAVFMIADGLFEYHVGRSGGHADYGNVLSVGATFIAVAFQTKQYWWRPRRRTRYQ